MTKTTLLGTMALALATISIQPLYAASSCSCDEKCQADCKEGKSENCKCKECHCKDGNCSHGKCSHEAKKDKVAK